jgi:GH15 family glucan-1,4-alpha-glucosidase
VADRTTDGYLPIEDYGAIGNLRSVALVGLDGSIDWCCLPELDRPSVFAAILDSQRGGRFRVAPAGRWRSDQHYLEGTNVLETRFEAERGRLSVTDFMPLHGSILGADDPLTAPEIHRILRCEEGEVEADVEWAPRFDYARAALRIERVTGGFAAGANGEHLTLGGLPADAVKIAEEEGGPVLYARLRLSAGEHIALVTRYGASDARAGLDESLSVLETTVHAWREWAHHCERPGECAFGGPWHPQVVRSGLALKLLTHPDTGAIAAAATTSLPEEIGGVRNWDYRFTWIRDAAFTSQALFALGHRAEVLDFLNWAHGVSSVKGDRPFGLQIMYGLHGETELPEIELEHLEGYRGSRPVRIGNGAAKQKQLDIYGELMGSAYELVRMGGALDPPLMAFLSHVADRACEAWREPDYGIWEVRGGPRHFVYSKVMVWVALDRAVRMAERWGLPGRVGRWRRNRDAVRQAILAEGYDRKVGAFVQSFGSKALDASNLLLPVLEFLPFDDPRVQGTIDRTLEHLTENGLVYRYRADDGLPGGEGAFALTTFWMVDALALSGRVEEAREMFEGVARRANHLGLYAEEFDPRTGAFLGNFPQAFSHIGFINSALYLARAEGRKAPAPAPVGSREHGHETGHETGAAT